MTAAIKHFIIEQKATFKKRMTYRDKLKKPINLTGCAAAMQIRDAEGVLLAELTTENGGIVLGGILGTIDLLIADAVTSLMTFAAAVYDLKLVFLDGTSQRLLQGKVTLSPGQTT